MRTSEKGDGRTASSSGETAFHEGQTGKVTDRRVVLGETTFPLANITSVHPHTIEPNRPRYVMGGLVVGLVFSCAMIVSEAPDWFAGLALAACSAIGVVAAARAEVWHAVRIGTAEGESQVTATGDQQEIARIVEAINAAIASWA